MSINSTEQKWLLKRRAKLDLSELQEKPPLEPREKRSLEEQPPSEPKQEPPSERSILRAIIYGLALLPLPLVINDKISTPLLPCAVLSGILLHFFIMRERSGYEMAVLVGGLTSVFGFLLFGFSYSFSLFTGAIESEWSVRSVPDAIFMGIFSFVAFFAFFGIRTAIYATVVAALIKYFGATDKNGFGRAK
ncbi:MAG: hypothetical protein LBQ52_08200 [Helicobacteraceae bacterium]|jgi:hypothetical protein|nr:hypothetical protein [Helicobacteraceae bacterium]